MNQKTKRKEKNRAKLFMKKQKKNCPENLPGLNWKCTQQVEKEVKL